MICYKIFLCLFATLASCSGDWVSDWMSPMQSEFQEETFRRNNDEDFKPFLDGPNDQERNSSPNKPELQKTESDLSTANLKLKLEETLQNAKELSQSLRHQIQELIKREALLKSAIANGRYGVSTLTVSTLSQVPRSYIIRDSRWMLCNGMIQFPVIGQGTQANLFNELFSEPRCIGREVPTVQDPCVFNSVIKYEVLPTHRALEYLEEDYLCLKPAFNNTLERYMSVTKQTVNETCKEGVVRSLAENNMECGVRVLSEYSFYPSRSSAAASLPLEYCAEKDGSCKLIAAWHVSNITIENFEFLKNEYNFKKYFIKAGSYVKHVM